MNKLMSIAIPAYNSAEYIGDTIESLLAQTYGNLEIVIVDDNSSDETYSVIEKYAAADSRIRIFKNEKNLGMAGNWNRCLQLCHGDYLKLVCADDLLAPDMVAKEIAALEANPEAVMVSSDTKLVDSNDKYCGMHKRYRKSGLVDGKKLVRHCFFTRDILGAPMANTFRREAYEKSGGFSFDFHYIVDYDFFVNIAKLGQIFIIHEPLNAFRVRKDSNTGQVMGGDKEKTAIYVDEHYRLFRKNQEELGLSEFDIKYAVFMRKMVCLGVGIYLKIFA